MDSIALGRLGLPFGLSFASGLNAYLPLLAFTLSVRWLHLYKVNPGFAFVTSNWFIAVLIVLTLLDFVADKIPVIDHTWDAIHTVIRPLAGAVVAAAAGTNSLPGIHGTVPSTMFDKARHPLVALGTFSATDLGLFIIFLIGGALAAMSHTAKATTRLFSTVTTAGLLNIGLSVLEDIAVLLIVLLSLFASTLMLVLLIILILLLVPGIIRARKNWSRRRRRA